MGRVRKWKNRIKGGGTLLNIEGERSENIRYLTKLNTYTDSRKRPTKRDAKR